MMTEQAFNLKGGVLIIGSLYWQDFVGRTNNNMNRSEWRNNRLNINAEISVLTPIRYGRLSNDNIYTMTFANSCRNKKLGSAFVVPFRENPILNFTQLMLEAQEIAIAEGMRRTFISSSNGTPWCVLGILFNKNKIIRMDKDKISDWWQMQLRLDSDYPNFHSDNFKHGSEKTCIYPSGVLNIPWPRAKYNKDKNQLDDYDFLVATATLPTENKYPKIKSLVNTIRTDQSRKYFLNNYKNGIRTFQDEMIIKKL